MPNVNLTDSRSRDAVVKAESTGVAEDLRYVDSSGNNAYTRKILKATVDHDYATLVEKYEEDKEKLGQALVDGDPEVDMEKCGLYLWGVSKVYVDSEDGIVYRIEQTEIVRDPSGAVKEKRARQRSEANVDIDIPLTWTGRKIDKAEAVRKFVFSSKLQIVHINGLTYDFLYGMAADLSESSSLMMIGGGSKGRDPLIFRSGSIPYRGFLEGRIDGEKYILLLHLSNMELKQVGENPEVEQEQKVVEKKSKADTVLSEEKSEAKDKSENSNADEETPEVKRAKKKLEKKSKPLPEPEESAKKENTESAAKEPKPKTKKAKVKKTDEKNNKNKKEKSESGKTDKDQRATTTKKDKVALATTSKADAAQVSTQDLGVWLKSIRMGKYLKVFVDNEIDVDVLSELTDDDLKELEIPLGSRRRLLKAVGEADNLRAEVVMAVQTMTGSKVKNKN